MNNPSLPKEYLDLEKLLADVAHEINNPLDGVIRFTNILLKQSENNSLNQEYILEIKNGLERIAHITKTLQVSSHRRSL